MAGAKNMMGIGNVLNGPTFLMVQPTICTIIFELVRELVRRTSSDFFNYQLN